MDLVRAEAAIIFADGIRHGKYWAGTVPQNGEWKPVMHFDGNIIAQYDSIPQLVRQAGLLAPIKEWTEDKTTE